MRTPTLEWGKAPGKTTGLIGRKWKHRKVFELTGTNRPRTYHKDATRPLCGSGTTTSTPIPQPGKGWVVDNSIELRRS